MLSTGLCAQIACIWETTARNPGNAHRFRDFSDTTYVDFLLSAAAIAPVLDAAGERPVGQTVLECIRATRRVVATNTNLGIVLLLAPLAAVSSCKDLRTGIEDLLQRVDVADARAVYQAIRLAAPAGLAVVAEQDLANEPTKTLREVMILAAERDLIARQYANGFREIFDDGVPALRGGLEGTKSIEEALVLCHLHLMSRHPDSLIARKRGQAEAEEASRRAQCVLGAVASEGRLFGEPLADFDCWLREVERGRNPGTTSDLVTACLFVCLREGIMKLPCPLPWCVESDS
jgi:triphosphoribosyl-dephospho-CoA synthase